MNAPEIRDRRGHLLYEVIRGLVAILVALIYRVRTVGQEHIPTTGAVVIGCNHIHNFDPFVVGVQCPRYIHFMAKEELFKFPLAAHVLRIIGAFPIRRGHGDKGAIRHALAVTAANQCLVVFPEGHRSKTGELGKGQPGIAMIARKSNCPVVPAVIIGQYGFRKALSIRFGEPFHPKPDDTNETLMETLMERIQELKQMGPL